MYYPAKKERRHTNYKTSLSDWFWVKTWKCVKQKHKPEVFSFPSFTELVKRFDDVDQRVRLRAAQILSVLFSGTPKNYDPEVNSARLLGLLGDAVIFLDDPDTKLQEAVVGKKPYASHCISRCSDPVLSPCNTCILPVFVKTCIIITHYYSTYSCTRKYGQCVSSIINQDTGGGSSQIQKFSVLSPTNRLYESIKSK